MLCSLWTISVLLAVVVRLGDALIVPTGFKCARGRFAQFASMLESRPECRRCPPGRWQAEETDWGLCKHCAIGQYSKTDGAVVCKACPRGLTAPVGSASCGASGAAKNAARAVAPSPVPQVRRGANDAKAKRTTSATAPQVRHAIAPRSSSFGCNWGQYSSLALVHGKFHRTCVVCPLGKFQPNAGQGGPCLLCPRGQWTKNDGARQCVRDQFAKSDGGQFEGMAYCPPGRYSANDASGAGGVGSSECKECPAGRYGLAGATAQHCTGLCRPGRYGSGGSTSPMCDGECNEGVFCRAGAKAPDDGGVCPRGKYQFEAPGVEGCFLTAPYEYRPKGGYESAQGEQAACILDKAMRMVELLFALRSCHSFRDRRRLRLRRRLRAAERDEGGYGHVCDAGLAASLAGDMQECCAGSTAERINVPRAVQEACARRIDGVVSALRGGRGGGLLHELTREEERVAGLHARGDVTEHLATDALWSSDATAAAAVVMPLMRKALVQSRALYENAPARDRTFVAAELLNVCQIGDDPDPLPGGRCRDDGMGLSHLIKYIEHFDCAITDCDTSLLKAFFAPRQIPTPAPVELPALSASPCTSADLTLLPSKTCGGCDEAAGVAGCFGHFKDSGIRHEHRPIYMQQSKVAYAASHSKACGSLPLRARVLLYFYCRDVDRKHCHWTISGAVGRRPFALLAWNQARSPNQVPPVAWRTGGDPTAEGGLDVSVDALCPTAAPTPSPTMRPTPAPPTPWPTHAPTSSPTPGPTPSPTSGKNSPESCVELMNKSHADKCGILVRIPKAFLSLADEQSAGVADCERCIRHEMSLQGCAKFVTSLEGRAKVSPAAHLVTWAATPLKLCLSGM